MLFVMSNNTNKTGTVDITLLLSEATDKTKSGSVKWYERLPKEAEPFIETLSDRVENQGVKANARVVCEILEREFNFEVSRSRVRIWLAKLEKRYEQKTQD
tara:strand:- start:419 stop:721 length:303 start_codon:yes stop_codon:yes gene_type:complete